MRIPLFYTNLSGINDSSFDCIFGMSHIAEVKRKRLLGWAEYRSATQLSAEDPDEPEAARDDRQNDVEDEVTESVLTIVSHDSFS